ncbi:MAG: prolyl oligopeptidase family serine peptidase [Gammaproteobacteria bacterium]|nr:prolyl oligopeptidase family serine peptidase [Gammaproteobacteria bacterium]
MAAARRLAIPLLLGQTGMIQANQDDPYIWLENVDGHRAMAWVKAQNLEVRKALAQGRFFEASERRLLAIFNSSDRIPFISKAGPHYYNFWQDADHPRGLWRRTTLDEYRKPAPSWETVLDIDALARDEQENWVFAGADFLEPTYDRCLIALSRGGADADVVREFDISTKSFIADGFRLAESKGSATWAGKDSLFVARDFGPDTLTDSGYPRIARLWRRGRSLADAEAIFEGRRTDISVGAYATLEPGYEEEFVYRGIDFHNTDLFIRREGALKAIDVPSDARATVHRGRLFVTLDTDWTVGKETYAAGSLLVADLEGFLAGERKLDVLYRPAPGTSLEQYSPMRNHVLINVLHNVRNRVYAVTPTADGWVRKDLTEASGMQTISVRAVDPHVDDRYFMDVADYLTPTTLSLRSVGEPGVTLKRMPGMFDAEGLSIAQEWATSEDGTRVPYFVVRNPKAKGPQPTLLYGYGGFGLSMTPGYSPGVGAMWLEQGGVYVVANIRGGGEFGPEWHQAALKENRPRAYEDFIAVAEDLIRRAITTSGHLGVMGGSNGGLLVGNMLTMRPDLFGAVVAQVPLLDMRRYHELLAGASWIAEYGDPDKPEEWAFIQKFSPYHNLDADTRYPPLLVTTSTRDDRVHPGHARKMAAKMADQGHRVFYYENVEGGHAGAADNAQRAFMWALAYGFLQRTLNGSNAGKTEDQAVRDPVPGNSLRH